MAEHIIGFLAGGVCFTLTLVWLMAWTKEEEQNDE